MSPFRKRSDLKTVAGGPVFVDLGSYPLPEADDRSEIILIRVLSEDVILRSEGKVPENGSVILDLSDYSGDRDAADSCIRGTFGSDGIVIDRIGSDVWLISHDGIVAYDSEEE